MTIIALILSQKIISWILAILVFIVIFLLAIP